MTYILGDSAAEWLSGQLYDLSGGENDFRLDEGWVNVAERIWYWPGWTNQEQEVYAVMAVDEMHCPMWVRLVECREHVVVRKMIVNSKRGWVIRKESVLEL